MERRAIPALFSHYPVKRLAAEQMLDAISQFTETSEKFRSIIPEPYSNWPATYRATQISDGNTECSFLDLFGRPPRDTPYEAERNNDATLKQALYFLNSEQLEGKVSGSPHLKRLLRQAGRRSGRRALPECALPLPDGRRKEAPRGLSGRRRSPPGRRPYRMWPGRCSTPRNSSSTTRQIIHAGYSRSSRLPAGSARRALLGLTLADWFRLKAPVRPSPKAKSVIQLWMAGGPTQTDTWDPKPNAGEDFTGPLRARHPHQRRRHPDRRTAAAAGQAGRQVHHHPRHDARQQRATRSPPTSCRPAACPPRNWSTPRWARSSLSRRARTASCRPTSRSPIRWDASAKPAFWATDRKTFAPGGDPNNANFRVQGLVPPRGMTRAAHQRAPLAAEIGGRPGRAQPTSTKSTARWTSSSRRPTA